MSETYTPMMQQYLDIKKNYQDAIVFMRLGDFYEMFFEDAKIGSKELDLVLTGKSAGVEERVPMCGIPYHAASSYIQRLISRGYKVAIVEQLEDPALAKGLVKRDVVKVITPGTVIDEISDEKSSVYIASIEDYLTGYSFSICEVSTGEIYIDHIDHQASSIKQTILKNNIKEVVLDEGFDASIISMLREIGTVISYCSETRIEKEYEPLCVNLNQSFDLHSFGRMINYLLETQKQALDHLQTPVIEDDHTILKMDYSTQINLELVKPLRENGSQETLWTFLDHCKCCMGSRLLKKWIEKPLLQKESIENRYDQVEWLINHFIERNKIREALGQVYDLQRLITRVSLHHANAIDLLRLSKTLNVTPSIFASLNDPCMKMFHLDQDLLELQALLENAFVENPPSLTTIGGMFQKGYNQQLDEARAFMNDGKNFISQLEAAEKERTGIKTLKIGYNKVFGYYVEISKAAAKEVKPEWGYIRKQTLVNNERFIFPELKEKEDAILHAQEHAIDLEKALFEQLCATVSKYLVKIQHLAYQLAYLDVLASFAHLSSQEGYVRPLISKDDRLSIIDGRHPILDVAMKKTHYVSNSCVMDQENEIYLITGPNMGGKSTYMRQVALLVIMSQMGCFVPAKEMETPLFDAIFTRIGASDDILSGQSTFMVEMNEANLALSNATSNSLILFDEVGRGTSTYDGMALAQAMLEYIATCIHAKTLFSTHYHELTSLTHSIPSVKNFHAQVLEEKDRVIFLYKMVEGEAKKSYGINVARLAHLPESIIERASDLLSQLESTKRVVQQNYQLIEMEKEDPWAKQMYETLTGLTMDEISPKDAWSILEDLCNQAKEKKE